MDAENLLKQKVVGYLKQIGLTSEQALAYLFLLQHGPQTVLSLSRGLKTGRTKLYPLLENLSEKQLITIHERHYGTSYEAQPPEVLEFLIAEKERKTKSLRSDLNSVTHALKNMNAQPPTTSKIIEYKGVDGLKQMNFNLTKAKKEFRVFELESLSSHLGNHFAKKLHRTWYDNHISSYNLTNNPNWQLKTDAIGLEKLSNARYIDPKIFTIEFETYIYNNCVALLNYEKDDILGVEIYNEKLARQQKRIFDLLWSQAHYIQ
ncbi:MAG: helix-turn-helix domain-containing protein [bacterium]|nr:helix-turn-helix domain-containing protein [bacterium]